MNLDNLKEELRKEIEKKRAILNRMIVEEEDKKNTEVQWRAGWINWEILQAGAGYKISSIYNRFCLFFNIYMKIRNKTRAIITSIMPIAQ